MKSRAVLAPLQARLTRRAAVPLEAVRLLALPLLALEAFAQVAQLARMKLAELPTAA